MHPFTGQVGDLVYARVESAHRDLEPVLSCVDAAGKVRAENFHAGCCLRRRGSMGTRPGCRSLLLPPPAPSPPALPRAARSAAARFPLVCLLVPSFTAPPFLAGTPWAPAGLGLCAPQKRHAGGCQLHARTGAAEVRTLCAQQPWRPPPAAPPGRRAASHVRLPTPAPSLLVGVSLLACSPPAAPAAPAPAPLPACSRPPAAVLSALGRSLQFELAVGLNGRVWLDAPRCVVVL